MIRAQNDCVIFRTLFLIFFTDMAHNYFLYNAGHQKQASFKEIKFFRQKDKISFTE